MKRIVFFAGLILSSCNIENEKSKNPTPEKIDEAALLEKEVTNYPDSLLLKENLLEYYRNKGDYTTALFYVSKYLNKDSSNPRLWHIKGILQFENEDTTGALNCFSKALSIRPDPNDIIYMATIKASRKDSVALSLADDLMSDNKSDYKKEANYIKGIFYKKTNDYIKAATFFDNCIGISYTFMEAYREKSDCLYMLGRYNDAATVLKKALTIQNSYDEGHYYLGRCYEKMNMKAEAIQSYHNALLYSPDYIEAKDALKRLGE